MKTFREFLGEAWLGGAKYAGKPNPNKLKGKTIKRGAEEDEGPMFDDSKENRIRDRAQSRMIRMGRYDSATTKHGYDLDAVHTRYKGKDMTHVGQGGGYGDNDSYRLKGRVSMKGVVSHHNREIGKYGDENF